LKPLIFIPSPRNLEEFNKSVEKIEYDKLWVKYYPQELAYVNARSWFLNRPEYTHLVILPDDLIATQKDIDTLLDPCPAVISGWCNIDNSSMSHLSNISDKTPPDPGVKLPDFDDYGFLTIEQIAELKTFFRLIKVGFGGFAPAVISRRVVEKIPFRESGGCCIDNTFAIDLEKAGIANWVDLEVRTHHLKTDNTMNWYGNILTGKEAPFVRFEKAG